MTKQAKLELLMGFYQKHGLTLSWSEVERLQRIARALQTNAENLCNIPNYEDKRDKLSESLKSKVLWRQMSPATNSPSVSFEVQGDPRGYCLKITCPDGFIVQPEHFN